MNDEIKEVLEKLGFADSADVEPWGHGRIHDTYRVRAAGRAILLQRINRTAFPDPQALVANAGRVTAALAEARARGAYPLELAQPVGPLVRRGESAWRATTFLDGTYAVDRPEDAGRASRGAEAFGMFAAALAELDPRALADVIPGFHDFDNRLAQLADAVREDAAGRAAGVTAEFDFCAGQQVLGGELRALRDALPRRVCHNDTKINNLLFDERDHRVRAVVDLDTCMASWWMYDLGDIVRTFCATEEEDSTRADRAGVREDFFAAVCRGFTRPLASRISPHERDSLWFGARAIPLMLAMRFLADHVAGDAYFRVSRPGQNLDRARNQLALYRDLTARENQLRPQLK